MANKIIPAISVIIPMYNAEKYISECLDSVLTQTFTDFEVIVIDNCSTDGSVAIVKEYINQNGDGKIKLLERSFNSGNAGIPRNEGIEIAQGKYVSFIDSDDAYTKTALEELYNVAEKSNATVIACEKWFQTPPNGDISNKDSLIIFNNPHIKYVDKPTLISNNMAERINQMYTYQFTSTVWSKLIRRDFIVKNNLKMIDAVGQDMIFTRCLLCSAKRYFRVPNVVNIYRIDKNSTFHAGQNDFNKVTKKWINALVRGFNYLDEFLDRQKTFQQHPDLKYSALEVVVREFTGYFTKFYMKFQPYQLDRFIREEFAKAENLPALTAFLFGRMNYFNVLLRQQQQNSKKLSK